MDFGRIEVPPESARWTWSEKWIVRIKPARQGPGGRHLSPLGGRRCFSHSYRRGPRFARRLGFRHNAGMAPTTDTGDAEISLRAMLYRFIWPFWLLRDVRQGSATDSVSAYRYNRAQLGHLWGYALKWLFMSGAMLQLLHLFPEDSTGAMAAAATAFLGVALAGSLGVLAVTLAICLYLWKVR
jgi:hypothetical protein